MKIILRSISLIALAALFILGFAGCSDADTTDNGNGGQTNETGTTLLKPKERLKVATTTSLYDTGLWSYLEPMFEEEYDIEVDVVYAGTGIALEYGRRGDVDVITVHSKAREEKFVADGHGVARVPFAYNYFLIVGPASDPAGIKGMSPEEAFTTLFENQEGIFISRGDDSGTYGKEKAIWAAAGYDYDTVREAGAWYVEAGRGMGPTLLMASEQEAYTLTDMGTYLSYKGETSLEPIIDQGAILLNVYSAIAVNPDKSSKINGEMAQKLVEFLTSAEIQKLIGDYGVVEYGLQLFIPCAGNEPTS
jgi:tungstate transport system substrate-binding protein